MAFVAGTVGGLCEFILVIISHDLNTVLNSHKNVALRIDPFSTDSIG